MGLRDWVQNGWLTEHQSSAKEIRNLLGLADRDLRTCQVKELDTDWRFAIAYRLQRRWPPPGIEQPGNPTTIG